MTQEEFYLKMATILTTYENSPETAHIEMDKLMCELLCELGYEKGVEVFRKSEKWYS